MLENVPSSQFQGNFIPIDNKDQIPKFEEEKLVDNNDARTFEHKSHKLEEEVISLLSYMKDESMKDESCDET